MNKYDYIIYNANLSGITAAVYLKRKGYSVLLLNFYGFPGGSPSENLNCLQQIPSESGAIAERIFSNISKEKNEILRGTSDLVFVNPETFKYVCQKILVESGIDLLFHVNPVVFNESAKMQQLILLGREGYLNYSADHFIDCSENYALCSLLPETKKEITGIYLNLIISGLQPEFKTKISELCTRKFLLEENRMWCSFELPKTEYNEIDVSGQIKQNTISESILKYGARIQLIPAQAQVIYKLINPGLSKHILGMDQLLNRSYNPDEEFIKAVQLENILINEGY